jgi:SP family facilitated glucose transporter-like MFS transporter 1
MSEQQQQPSNPPTSNDDNKIDSAVGVTKDVEQREPLLISRQEGGAGAGDDLKAKRIVPEGRWTKSLIFAVLAAAFGSSFQFGYHIGCINLPADLIIQWFAEQMVSDTTTATARWGIAVGIFAVGGMIGGNLVGIVATKLGRKQALLYNNVLAIIAGVLMGGAKYVGNYWLFILGRLIVGINSGLNSGLAPMYLLEVSPANLRGAIGSFAQLFVTIAILFSQILGLPFLLGTVDRWPLIFAFTFVPVIVQLCTLTFCPETPEFTIVVKGQRDQAEKDLKKLREREDVSAELDLISEEASKSNTGTPSSMKDIYGTRIPWPLILALFMMISQQLSGINAAMFYSTAIFKGAGLKDQWPNYATIAMGAINVLMTVVSVYLVEHPRFGRRTLHIAGMVGMCFSTAFIAISMLVAKSIEFVSFLSIIFVLLFVISFATGPGSIPWFYVNEMFPPNLRGVASTCAVTVNWICCILVATLFPIIDGFLHEYSFFVFTILLIVFILFALKFLPETKNKTLEQVYEEMDTRRGVKTKINNQV